MTAQPDRTTMTPVEIEGASGTPPQGPRPEEDTPRAKSPEEFYREMTARTEVRAFLKRLADL